MTIHAQTTGSLVTIECSDVLTMDDLIPLFGAFDKARRTGPFVVLTDTTRMKSAPRDVVGAFTDRLKRMPQLRGTWLGDAVVVQSSAVRFVLSTLLMVAPMPTEVKAFDSRREAVRWCSEILRKSGVQIPIGTAV